MRRARSKYGNVKTTVDGIVFASAKEARRWGELKLLERAGVISNLRRQTRYTLSLNGFKVTAYVADFDYDENGLPVTEDSKGFETPAFKIKAKLFRAIYGREIKTT